jgi:hypothetical protein
MEKHLWEIDHPYYCSTSNYFSNECNKNFKSWNDFIEAEGESDFDYNYLIRFDWREGEDNDLPAYNGDDYYRNGVLELFWVSQRKGLFRSNTIEVCRKDEKEILEFLKKRWAYINHLWQPFGDTSLEYTNEPEETK